MYIFKNINIFRHLELEIALAIFQLQVTKNAIETIQQGKG